MYLDYAERQARRGKEFEKFRVLQDRTYQSDFDRLVAQTSDVLMG